MALDTNLTPEVVNSYNTYINGNKAIGVTSEISMPTITSETIDVSGTGILGKISAPNIGQFESIEQEITFNLIYSSFVDMLSPKRQVNLTIRAAQQAVDKNLGYAYKGLRIVEVGRVKEFTPGKIKPGEGMDAKVKLELTYLMIENDGQQIIEMANMPCAPTASARRATRPRYCGAWRITLWRATAPWPWPPPVLPQTWPPSC